MVVNIANVRDLRPKLLNQLSQAAPRVLRVNRMCGQPGTSEQPGSRILEIKGRDKIAILRRWGSARVRHGKQRRIVPLVAHQAHEIEEVDLGAAEWIVLYLLQYRIRIRETAASCGVLEKNFAESSQVRFAMEMPAHMFPRGA